MASTGQNGRSLENTIANYANVVDYGAIGDGVTNNNTAFAAAIASGKSLYIPDGTFLTTGYQTLSTGQGILGNGDKSILKITDNGYTFWLAQGSHVDNVKFLGDGRDTGKTLQVGLFIYNFSNISITRCTFQDIGGYGVYLYNTLSGGTGRSGVTISDCFGYNSNIPYFMSDGSGEYNRLIGCVSTRCTIGAKMSEGNNQIIGCNFTDNTTYGLQVTTGGSNLGHTNIVNLKANHNTIANLQVTGNQASLNFTGCDFQVGALEFINTDSIIFSGCNFYTENIIINNSTNIYFTSSNKRYNSTFTVTGTSSYFEKGVMNVFNSTFTPYEAPNQPSIDVLGSVKMNRTLITGNYSVLSDDYIITTNNLAANITITLPDASTCENRIFIIKRFDDNSTGTITIDTAGGSIQDPNSGSFGANISLSLWGNPGYFARIQSNGVNFEAV